MKIKGLLMNRRKELGMSLEDVGKAVGVNKATVLRWERGEIGKIKRSHIAALSRTLGIDPMFLVKEPVVLTNEEEQLLDAYNAADFSTQQNIRKILDLPEKKEENESAI